MKRYQVEEEGAPSEDVLPPFKISRLDEVVVPSTDILSNDERQKLSPQYWIKYPSGSEPILICIPIIRDAYLSIKKNSGTTHLTDFLDSTRDMGTMLHFTHCIKRTTDFLKEIQAARMTLSDLIGNDVPHHVVNSAAPGETCDPETQSEGESFQNSHRIFLIAKHILEQFDIHPTRGDQLSSPQFVEAGVKMLKSELRSAESELLDALTRGLSFNPRGCSDVVEKIYRLASKFRVHLYFSSTYVRGRDIFEKVGRLLYPDYNIDGSKLDDFQKNFRMILKDMRGKVVVGE